jgi:hypothetical protein
MSADAAEIQAARFSWEEGLRRLESDRSAVRGLRNELSFAVVDELRRQVGVTFTMADLARAYRTASRWYFDVAVRVAPDETDAWDPALALDAGFARMARMATDAPGRGRD